MKLSVPVLCCALAVATATASRAAVPPQDVQRAPLIIGAEVEVVSVPVLVFDKGGRFIPDLKKEDITILEDGVAQEIMYLSSSTGADRIPLSIALVLDTSGSMSPSIDFLKESATFFTSKLESDDQALVVQFNETVKSSSEFSNDTERMDSYINGMQVWGGTALYDAVMYGLDRLRDRPGRKALILLSDGDDSGSSQASKGQVTALAKSLDVSIYSVGIEGFDTPKGFLKNLAQDTGGTYHFPNKVSELIKVFDEIAKDLKNNYLVAYSPKRAADNTYRKIEVRVARPEVTVRVRPGYMAAKKRRNRAQ